MEMMNLLFPLERTFMRRLLAVPAREMKLFESQLYRKRRFFTSMLFLNITQGVSCLIVASGRQMCFPVKVVVTSAHFRLFLCL